MQSQKKPLDQWLCHADARQVSDLPEESSKGLVEKNREKIFGFCSKMWPIR
jgi:hypothetical protein